MPFTESAIAELAREPLRTPGWSSRLLMLSGTIFFVSVFVYFGLVFGYKPYLENQVQKLNDQIQSFSQKISVEDQENIVRFYSQSTNLKTLLGNHVTPSPILRWLEQNTHTGVFFTRFVLNTNQNQLSLSGAGRTAADAGAQAIIFERAAAVERVNLTSVSVGPTGLWEFTLTLFLRPEFVRGETE